MLGAGDVDPMPPVWVSDAMHVAAQVDPAAVAEQAVRQLAFGSPSIEMAPPDGSPQLVSVPTWLWLDPGTCNPDRHGDRRHSDGHRQGDLKRP